MFCDQVKVRFVAGRGGDGCVSFRREKFVAKGGPDGGDGGNGGSVILRATNKINTLYQFNLYKYFKADDGKGGKGKNMHGAKADDLILDVPIGTMVKDLNGGLVQDLKKIGDEFVVVRGGKGGFGNAHFKSSTRQAPRFAEYGERGEEAEYELELKLVADVSIIGLPSAGKSTLISRISGAKPKIAAYHFTTLIPNLGVVNLSKFGGSMEENFVIADIPGLIEGAHQGKGLGHKFLRHTSRTKVIVHLVDPFQGDIVENFNLINSELKNYDPELAKKKQIVVLPKIDSLTEEETKKYVDSLKKVSGEDVYLISSHVGDGLKELVFKIWDELSKFEEEIIEEEVDESVVYEPHKEENDKRCKVEFIKTRKNPETMKTQGVYRASGKRLEQIVNMSDLQNYEALERIYDVFYRFGVEKELKKLGCTKNDVVRVGEHEIRFRG